MKKIPDPNCEFCGGTGIEVIPAHQRGGDVVDEQERDCPCTKSESIADLMDDDSDDFDPSELDARDEFGIERGLPDDF